MKLVFQQRAREDLDEIASYIARDNPTAAHVTIKKICQRLAILTDFPDLGRPGLIPDTREYIISGMSYTAPYRIRGQEIQIMRIYHSARAPLALSDSH